MKKNNSKTHAFTLIELLVVVGIIVLLLAIILPALTYAKHIANTAVCTSNLRQLGLNTAAYEIDNHAKVWNWNWYSAGAPYIWINLLIPYGGMDKARFCPEANSSSLPDANGNSTLGNNGAHDSNGHNCWTSHTAWTLFPEPYIHPFTNGIINPLDTTYWNTQVPAQMQGAVPVGSYGINGWLYNTSTNSGQDIQAPHWPNTISGNCARIPMYAESLWPDGWPWSNWATTGDLTSDPYYYFNDGGIGRFCIARHRSMNTNIVFVDGHVEFVPLPKLWTLQWSQNVAPNNVFQYQWPAAMPVVPQPSVW